MRPSSSTTKTRPTSAATTARPQSAVATAAAVAPDQQGGGTRVQVAVRVRPINRSDASDDRVVLAADPVDPNSIVVDDSRRGRTFSFDHVFFGDQKAVYHGIGRPLLEEAYKGFNTCLFAYGQTGSGKTYSIQGEPAHGEEHAGLLHHLVREMFRSAQSQVAADSALTVKITMSYLEVYMERVRDLLIDRSRGQEPESLEVQEDKNRKITVKGLSVHSVLGADRVEELLAIGNANRQTAETKMNEVSSRSHSIVQFTITQLHEALDRRDVESVVSIVDLAGSERQGKSEATGVQFEEAKKINQSLLSLGRALHAFSEGRGEMVSLRESKLTRLLSESFGGNSKTWMLATVSPANFHLTESLSTLEYATHAKNITNRATINKMARHLELIELRDMSNTLMAAAGSLEEGLREEKDYHETLLVEAAELRKAIEICDKATEIQSKLVDVTKERDRLRGELLSLWTAKNLEPAVTLDSKCIPCFLGKGLVSLAALTSKPFVDTSVFLQREEDADENTRVTVHAERLHSDPCACVIRVEQVAGLPLRCTAASCRLGVAGLADTQVSSAVKMRTSADGIVRLRFEQQYVLASLEEYALLRVELMITGYC